ncbi:hypothetical protein H9P43_001593 [Blastocladiella emersonii ATCC 22665]|nr:hypothetical protein H9P43_001593 [Blastocladiella emersonii ATCC 22665]
MSTNHPEVDLTDARARQATSTSVATVTPSRSALPTVQQPSTGSVHHDIGETVLHQVLPSDRPADATFLGAVDPAEIPLPRSRAPSSAMHLARPVRAPATTTVPDREPQRLTLHRVASPATPTSPPVAPGSSGWLDPTEFTEVTIDSATGAQTTVAVVTGPSELTNDAQMMAAVIREARAGGVEYPGHRHQAAGYAVDGTARPTRRDVVPLDLPSFTSTPTSSSCAGTSLGSSVETLRSESGDGHGERKLADPIKDADAATRPAGKDGPGGIPAPVPLTAVSAHWAAYFFDLVLCVADLALNIAYLATFTPACHALVSPALPYLSGATAAFNLILLATLVGVLLFAWDLNAAIRVRSRGFSWSQALAHAHRRRARDLYAASFTGAKARAVAGIFLRDTLTLTVVLANAGPRDVTVPMALRFGLSAWTAARDSALLTAVFYAHCCGMCAGRRPAHYYYRAWPFRATKWALTLLTFAWSVLTPAILIAVPDLLRHVYVARPAIPATVELAVVCARDFKAPSLPASTLCNPTLCAGPAAASSILPTWTGWSPVHNATITLTNVRVCTSRRVATVQPANITASGYAALAAEFPLPDGRTATYFGDVPCAAPIITVPASAVPSDTGLTPDELEAMGVVGAQRAPETAWAGSLAAGPAARVLARHAGRSPYRAGLAGPEMDVREYAAGYAAGTAANVYTAGDRAKMMPRGGRAGVVGMACTRNWMVPMTDAASGDRFLLAVKVEHAETVRGPLSCSFNGDGMPVAKRRA